MKKLLPIVMLLFSIATFAQVGVNTTTPDPSSMLDITATDKGMLVPRMTAAQKTAITAPANGLLVYQTDAPAGFYYYNGTTWTQLGSTASEMQRISGLVRNTTDLTNDNFVFGSTQLNNDTSILTDNNRMFFNKAKGAFRAGEGSNTTWDNANVGLRSFAAGSNNTASGITSTAMGNGSIASGDNSTAIGTSTIASGFNSTTMGTDTKASGSASTAVGSSTSASGYSSTAMGELTTASAYVETTIGALNTEAINPNANLFVATDRLFTIGNGTRTGFPPVFNKSNALTILKNGNTAIGNINPTERLEVDGKTKTTNLQVTTGTAAVVGQVLTATDANGNMAWQTPATSGTTETASNGLTKTVNDIQLGGALTANTTITQTAAQALNFNNNGTANTTKNLQSTGDFDIQDNGTSALFVGDTANVGIGTNTPDVSAQLDITSTTGGVLLPRMTTAQRDGIASPKSGLTIYNTTTRKFQGYVEALINLDQAQTTSNATSSGSTEYGQSFIAGQTGQLVSVEFISTTANAAATLVVGAGTLAGSNTTTFNMVVGTNVVTLSTPLAITATSVYNFRVNASNLAISFSNTDAYAGGVLLQPGAGFFANFDFYFKTNVQSFSGAWQDLNITIPAATPETDPKVATTTTNQIPKWNGTNLVDGIITDNGTNIGIGVAPTEKLDVAGKTKTTNLQVTAGTPAIGQVLTATDANGNMAWATPATATSEMQRISGLVRNTTDTANDNFVFGSTSLDNIAGTTDDKRMFFNKTKGAFRVGQSDLTKWDNANVGSNSFASGIATTASGTASTAMGTISTASGNESTAMGFRTTASGVSSTAMGNRTTASGGRSTAMGSNTTASGESSTAMGGFTTAQSFFETTLGVLNTDASSPDASFFVATDRLFTIGNGDYNSGTKSNAITVLKNGNTAIGNINPTERLEVDGKTKTTNLQVTAGTPAAGKVLTATDAAGNATWQAPATVGVKFYIVAFGVFPSVGSGNLHGGSGEMTMGTIFMHVANSTVTGNSIPCDGRLLNISTYTALFSIIGTTYGGNGTTNFAVPNFTVGSGPVQR